MGKASVTAEAGPQCRTCGDVIPEQSPMGMCPRCTFSRVAQSLVETPFSEEIVRPEVEGYELGGLLGRGGMGDVYLATEIKFDRLVAIKVLRPAAGNGDDREELKARFYHEVKALSALSHPSIVTIFHFGETVKGDPFLVMEYVEGADLRKRLSEGIPDAATILRWGRQICGALEYAHGRGIVHRDIKPANVLVSEDGYVKLLDFGLAKIRPKDQVAGLSMTFSQVAIGTPDYVAPEQILQSGEADHRADIYSLGVLLYEMATLQIPRGSWRKASQLNPCLGKGFDLLIEQSLLPDPDQRLQSIEEFGKQLEAVTLGAPIRGRFFLWQVTFSIVAVVFLLASLFFFANKLNDSTQNEERLYEKLHAAPAPLGALPYSQDLIPHISRKKRPDSLPISGDQTLDQSVVLWRRTGRTISEVEIPDEVDLRSIDAFEWISQSEFVAPAKEGGIAIVRIGADRAYAQVLLDGLQDIVHIEATASAGIALRSDGEVIAWPAGFPHPFFPPKKPLRDVVKIAAGAEHGATLHKDGSVRVWGGTHHAEMKTPYPFDNVVDIGAGEAYTAVLTDNGRVFVWGDNTYGQCDVPGDLPPVAAIACLDRSVYALLENGLLRGWGLGVAPSTGGANPPLYRRILAPSRSAALLGERTSGEWELIAGGEPGDWASISASENLFSRLHAATIMGEFLLGWKIPSVSLPFADEATPAKLISIPRDSLGEGGIGTGAIPEECVGVLHFDASYAPSKPYPINHAVAVTGDYSVVTWGSNYHGQQEVPVMEGKVLDVVAGDRFCAALTDCGNIYVWGASSERIPLTPISHLHFVAIDAGAKHGVALDEEGRFFGWGNNLKNQLTPPDPEERFRLVAAAGDTTMAVTVDGDVHIWGDTKSYNRGEVPLEIQAYANAIKKIGLGLTTCWALLQDGRLVGWGNVGRAIDSEKPLWLPYPKALQGVLDFWSGDCGLVVKKTDGTYQGFHVSWSDDELTHRLNGAVDVRVSASEIFAAIR